MTDQGTSLPLTRDQADRLLELQARTVFAVETLAQSNLDGRLGKIETLLRPVSAHYDTLNQEHADAQAEAVEAARRRKSAEDNAVSSWLAWLTPQRAAQIIFALLTAFGLVAPMTGGTGKYQALFDSVMTVQAPATVKEGSTHEQAP